MHSTLTRHLDKWVNILTLFSLLGLSAHSQAQQAQSAINRADANTASSLPNQSCREIAARSAQNRDGRYLLQLRGQSVPLYCHDMAGEPLEYLELPEGNCSEYTSITHTIRRVQTCFQRVRLDPETLRVDIGDLRFSETYKLGVITHGKSMVNAMPYATAMSCDAPRFPAGKASITLTGTSFDVVDTFKAQGYLADGNVYRDDGEQRVQLRGGGYCGWITPGHVYNPMYTADWNPLQNSSGYLLQLRILSDKEKK